MTGTVTVGAPAASPTTAPPATTAPSATTAPPTTAPPGDDGPAATTPNAPPTTPDRCPGDGAAAGTGSSSFQEVPDDPRCPDAAGRRRRDSVVDVAPPPTVPPATAPPGPTD